MATTDMPVRHCRRCKAVWVEDSQMYEEPERCPHCGADPDTGALSKPDAIDIDP